MANYWMHNGFLQVEGEKMSKSLGNFVTIHELLHTEKFGGRKWPGEVLRLAMLTTHYRQPIDWTVKALEEARELADWMNARRIEQSRRWAELCIAYATKLADLPMKFIDWTLVRRPELSLQCELAISHRLRKAGYGSALKGCRYSCWA